jgi:hypothetical protein
MSKRNSKEGVKMGIEEIVKEVLADQNCKENDIMFLLQCWRKQGCNAYFNYAHLYKADSPRKLLEMKDLAMKEEHKEKKPVVEEKKSVKATPKIKTKAEKETVNKPIGSKITEE